MLEILTPRSCSSESRFLLACFTAASTLGLIFVGGLVTSTGSGLSVPDWPLSYGMLMPPMVGGVRYEHGHRMVAAFVGLLTLALAIWTSRAESRPGVRLLAWGALLAVLAQGILGGLTVIYLLPTPVSVAHACLAQAFFCLTIALAYATSREWVAHAPPQLDREGMRGAAALATGLVYVQLAVGAVMRHIGAGLAIPDFPLAFGRLVPPLENAAVSVHLAHRVGALAVLIALCRLIVVAERTRDPRFTRLSRLLLALALLQLTLGAATVLSGKAVAPTTAHVTVGAAVLGGCFFLTLRAFRTLRRAGALAAALPLGQPATSP